MARRLGIIVSTVVIASLVATDGAWACCCMNRLFNSCGCYGSSCGAWQYSPCCEPAACCDPCTGGVGVTNSAGCAVTGSTSAAPAQPPAAGSAQMPPQTAPEALRDLKLNFSLEPKPEPKPEPKAARPDPADDRHSQGG